MVCASATPNVGAPVLRQTKAACRMRNASTKAFLQRGPFSAPVWASGLALVRSVNNKRMPRLEKLRAEGRISRP